MAKLAKTTHALLESTVIHVLAMWIGLFAALLLGPKGAGGTIIVETIVAFCVPFFVAGFIVGRQNTLVPMALSPISAVVAMVFHAAVISYYMWNRIEIAWQQLPYLSLAVFSLFGVIAANAVQTKD